MLTLFTDDLAASKKVSTLLCFVRASFWSRD